ncbi:outer membrane protein with beta-barrel domain [Ulvibacter sp. MAR_2010_11]|uniref:porin family protein n=1 Tax=Ulvibacter sp. MAR_2010_11 TaxID=1250229 RepID=UPI000C2BB6DA|nr:porin family protein [Ulvibacter sp. MAR_2010_11]PKA84304.1 outer membrane protein with beta-barrel domain [Ulvibacter sp. MAR_2010_11]
MKKLLIMAAIAVFGFTTANAQGVSFGVKAGANFASINGDDADDLDGRTSFHVGGVVNIGISELFAVQPELVYSAQGFEFEDVKGKLDYVNIPIMADFTVADGLSLQGGPQVGINISAKQEFDGETEDIDDIETLDLGFGAGAQYRLPDMGLFFQARYVIGFNDIVEDFAGKNSVISLSVGWFFN